VAQLDGVSVPQALAYHVAAARELFEEAGVLLARHPNGDYVSLAAVADHARLKDDRVRVHDGQTTMRAVIEREGLRLALDALVLFAHWVTPPIDTRQFDTRFFMTRVPPHQTPAHDDTETTHGIWITPADAIAQSQSGAIVLPPPTWSTIRELEPFTSVDEALTWARRRRVVSRQPLMLEQDGLRLLLAPGDPLHPDPAGDEPLAETRFVFVDGRWRAERAR
jgi:8-oxo-dGTP pyrophosphatase MutT (NUDIX family)